MHSLILSSALLCERERLIPQSSTATHTHTHIHSSTTRIRPEEIFCLGKEPRVYAYMAHPQRERVEKARARTSLARARASSRGLNNSAAKHRTRIFLCYTQLRSNSLSLSLSESLARESTIPLFYLRPSLLGGLRIFKNRELPTTCVLPK